MVLFCIGAYALLAKRNIVKKIIGLGIMDYALNYFFILLGYKPDSEAPILSAGMDAAKTSFVDPLPQALILTSIVIGLAVTMLMVGIAIRLYEKYGTFDIEEIRRLKG
jgi:multicomponent Na+:H+ antiporter subunit C